MKHKVSQSKKDTNIMKKKPLVLTSLTIFAFLGLNPVFAETAKSNDTDKAHAKKSVHWGYSGKQGPEFWGDLSASYSSCKTGNNQSPVDIDMKNSVLDANLPAIPFDYNIITPSTIVNNGHTVQVNMWSGGEIIVDNIKFTLKQFHFHTPSENTVNGQHFPLEAHFVHLSDKNEIAVVAVFFSPGPDDPTLASLWKKLPMNKGDKEKLASNALKTLQMEKKISSYYRFNGSLTTPPCTEGVRWIVMKRPFHVSRAQVEKLQKALKHPNNRPTQPLNARVIVE